MKTLSKIASWGDSHHAGWLDIFRIILGGFIFYKGVEFGRHPQEIMEVVRGTGLSLFSFFLIQFIPLVHLAGGVMIAFGLRTRWAVIFQLPIVATAILLDLLSGTPFDIYSKITPTIIIFIGLMVFLFFGSGSYSADKFLDKN